MAIIYAKRGEQILVDDADYEWLNQYKWSIGEGYALGWVNGQTISMHRLIHPSSSPLITDHRNRNRLDNRRANLRTASRSENSFNTSGPRKVLYDEPTRKYWLLRGHTLIGMYDGEIAARMAYDQAAYSKSPAITNTTIPSD